MTPHQVWRMTSKSVHTEKCPTSGDLQTKIRMRASVRPHTHRYVFLGYLDLCLELDWVTYRRRYRHYTGTIRIGCNGELNVFSLPKEYDTYRANAY